MGEILELTESAYFPCFKTLFRNVVAALTEVRDICVYIKPVEELMEHIGTLEFPDVAEMLPAVMHTVCLLWGNSRYYCTSPRIILLIKEISNQLIRQSSDCLDPSSLFQGELDEAQERVTMCIETLQNFKEVFEESRGNLGSGYFKNSEPVMWNFKSKIVFERLNQYIERLEKVQTVFDAGVEYSKLEKVEIGGLKGRILGQKVEELFEEFKNIFSGFTKIEYDPLNPDDRSFEKDEVVFKDNMKDLEGRLAAIITQAFDDCANFESLSKLIQVAGSLMDRSIAKEDMKERMPRVLEVYSKDLDVVKVIFDEYREAKEENGFYDVDCYFPPTAGAMTFVHKLRCRIQAPMEFFSEWENPIVETPDMEHVRHKYDEMKEKLDGLWDSLYSEWAARVPNEVNTNLAKTLLTRHEDNTISTNFAPELVAALRECRYLQFLDLLDNVPAPAKELFDRSEELHLWVTTLNRIVEWYNEILKRCIPVEFDLIREEMNGIDNYIQEVQDKLNWKSDGVWPYVENIRDLTRALHGRVVQAQANVEHITGLLDNFAHIPLFERDEKAGLLALADRTTRVNKRFTEVRAAADQIHLKMDENYKLFHNVPLEEPEPEAPPRKKRLKKRFDDDGNEIPWDEGEEEWESYDEDEEGEEEHVEEEEEEESSSEESSESSEELWSSDSEMGGRKAVKEQAVEGWDFDTWAEDGDGQAEDGGGQEPPHALAQTSTAPVEQEGEEEAEQVGGSATGSATGAAEGAAEDGEEAVERLGGEEGSAAARTSQAGSAAASNQSGGSGAKPPAEQAEVGSSGATESVSASISLGVSKEAARAARAARAFVSSQAERGSAASGLLSAATKRSETESIRVSCQAAAAPLTAGF
ncbi:dynein beta chain, ciliary-like [Frankliniella occidentalis]|uniref:Dynein beta chain, ciliary-like n=1 Tax=Frankliniella occidentalis TaxID=133901 RepID=A0A9C6XVF5_FRAOC|nr:dynein beta chain, ciliary-like [Frankliniella occidentalis]